MKKSSKDSMKIISLEAQNVLKLKAVTIKPDGSAIIIGGKNAQGKSSVLNSIMSALGGKSFVAEQSVRKGEKKGFVELDLGKYKVRRTFTENGGGTVIVETPEGARFTSPQNMLDGLLSTISFDPLAFSRMKIQDQIEILKKVSGVDTSELDREYTEVFDARADVKRELKRLEGVLTSMESHEDAPAEPVSVSALAQELESVSKTNQDVLDKKNHVLDQVKDRDELQGEIEELEQELELKRKKLSELKDWLADNQDTIEGLENIDPDPIREKIKTAEETNQKVMDNASYTGTKKEIAAQEKESEEKSTRLGEIKAEKVKLVSKSDLPIKDLMFDDSGITFQDIPFDQASDAEKLRVSVSLGLAMNPALKVMLIRDGSLLDEDNLAMITKMAEKADGQVWIERVGTGEEMTVIMEDGEIKE